MDKRRDYFQALIYSAMVSTDKSMVDPNDVLLYRYPPVNITQRYDPDIDGAIASPGLRYGGMVGDGIE